MCARKLGPFKAGGPLSNPDRITEDKLIKRKVESAGSVEPPAGVGPTKPPRFLLSRPSTIPSNRQISVRIWPIPAFEPRHLSFLVVRQLWSRAAPPGDLLGCTTPAMNRGDEAPVSILAWLASSPQSCEKFAGGLALSNLVVFRCIRETLTWGDTKCKTN